MQKKAEKQVSGRRMVTVVMLNEQRLEVAVEVCKHVIAYEAYLIFRVHYFLFVFTYCNGYEYRHFLFIELNKSSRTFHSNHKIYWYHRKDLFWPHQN